MVWAEWEQLKADAAERGSTPMRFDKQSADSDGGTPSGSEDLKSSKRAWVKAGESTTHLVEAADTALRRLDEGQSEVNATAGSQGAAAQRELYESWHRYVKSVQARCKSLGDLLQLSGHDLSKTDESLKSELDAFRRSYEDTEALSGRLREK
ncbi:hypothetical protein ACFW5D_31075 [Streptomyces sp. NPDC058770]|uniref:hypothetical protein n=1 Tax=Streptomyces sp. NPDC058770 TaxID=3346631 RepID=UPI0036C92629